MVCDHAAQLRALVMQQRSEAGQIKTLEWIGKSIKYSYYSACELSMLFKTCASTNAKSLLLSGLKYPEAEQLPQL